MDVNAARTAITLICFLAFLGIVWWAYGRGRRERFDEAANLPFADEEMQRRTLETERGEDVRPDERTAGGYARNGADGDDANGGAPDRQSRAEREGEGR